MRIRTWIGAAVLAAGMWPVTALCGDGVLEINQVCANAGCFPGDAPGLPVEITAQGSYRLTGNLIASNGATAISIQTGGVALDLGGFTIGPCTNVPGLCPIFLEEDGVSGPAANDVTLRNGIVEAFRGDGVDLGQRARVEDLVIRSNARNGLRVLQNSIVRNNRISGNGGVGASLGAGTSWGGNVLTQNGTNFSGNAVAVMQNVCDGRPCSSMTAEARRFYLSSSTAPKTAAEDVCADGYRVAWVAELTNPSTLLYDETLGESPLSALRMGQAESGWVADGCRVAEFVGDDLDVFGTGQWTVTDPGICASQRRVWCIQE